MRFLDRGEAGRALGIRLAALTHRSDVTVVAVRAGGVPVAYEVARALGAPLEWLPVAAIGVPGGRGGAIGAVAYHGAEVIDERLIASLGVPHALVRQEAARARLSLERGGSLAVCAPIATARSRTVVVVDDGLVEASIAEAAVLALRGLGAGRVIVAAPAGSRAVRERLRVVADDAICLATLDPFVAVADQFERCPHVTEADIREYFRLAGRQSSGESNTPAELIRARAQRLTGDQSDYDRLLDGIGDARIVLIGGATHGTHEFYRERALMTRRLIRDKHFAAVAVEADWPDAYRVNRYVLGAGADVEAVDALAGFQRFPTWMWRNADVLDFVGWLRARNDACDPDRRAGFYGLDLYSLRASIDAVLVYLAKVDPAAAERARRRYACFDRFDGEMQAYAYATGSGLAESCEQDVVSQLMDLRRRRADYAGRNGRVAPDDLFFAEQNAKLVTHAEEYYRTMLRGRRDSWNLRDRHMAATLGDLLDFLDRTRPGARIVVWAHNSHVGDARATEMGEQGELNLGQLVRERFAGDAILVGFTTSTGTVTAATEWDAPAQRKDLRRPLPGSCEWLLHETGVPRLLLPLRTDPDLAGLFEAPRLERAVGVLYLPQSERASHYFHARLSEQFDYVVHVDHTRAVEPLERTGEWAAEVAETYPSGL
jgi:erythromycin esterase-like protein/predicted phosphoribosyltransferase